MTFKFLSIFIAFILIFLSLVMLAGGFSENIILVKLNLALQLAMLLIFIFWLYRRSRSFINAPALFIISIFYWHSAFFFCYFFQVVPLFEFTGNVFRYGFVKIPETIAFLGVCLSCMVIGSVLGYNQQLKIFKKNELFFEKRKSALSKKIILTILLLYSCLTFLYLIKIGIGFFSEKYSNAFYLIQPNSFLYRSYQATKYCLITIIITALAYTRKASRFFVLFIFLVLILIQFLLGSRSVPFVMIIALAVSWDHFVKKLSWRTLLIFVVSLAFMNCVVSYSRAVVGLGWNVFNFAATGRHSVNLWQFIWDAQQGGVVARTMYFLSETGDFLYGRSFFDALVYLLPRMIVDGLGFHTGFLVPSEWLVQRSSDVLAGGGMGFSLAAEAYLNFGIAGCLLFIYLGWFISKNYFKYIFFKDIYALMHALNFSLILSLHMRSDIGSYMRYLVYGFLFIEMLKIMDKRTCR